MFSIRPATILPSQVFLSKWKPLPQTPRDQGHIHLSDHSHQCAAQIHAAPQRHAVPLCSHRSHTSDCIQDCLWRFPFIQVDTSESFTKAAGSAWDSRGWFTSHPRCIHFNWLVGSPRYSSSCRFVDQTSHHVSCSCCEGLPWPKCVNNCP